MLKFRDFVPEVTPGSFWASRYPQYQGLEEQAAEASAWIEREGIQVVNVETVVLPNFRNEEGTTDTDLVTLQGNAQWGQFIRIWYRDG